MKTPVLLLGAAVIFWGWQTGLWIVAVPMAVILEAANFLPSRWDFSNDDFRRIANLCLAILICLFVYLLIANRSIYLIYNLLQGLPVVFFPYLTAQNYSVNEIVDVRTLFLLPNSAITKEKAQRFSLNLNYLYFALCIFSAGTANSKSIYFYIGTFILISIALWFVRAKRFSPAIWLCLILLAGSMGFIGQIGIQQLQTKLEDTVVTWLSNTTEQESNSAKKNTNIGEIGSLKRSNEIVFRVNAESKHIPLLLREATYNKYQSSVWTALNPGFTPIQPDSNGTTWRLADKLAHSSTITIAATLHHGSDNLLKLADGTFQIDDLAVSQMYRNQYGAVKVVGNVDTVAYKVQFDRSLSLDSPPTQADLQVANKEIPAINQILSQLDIQGKSPQEILRRVDRFFLKNFSYSLTLTGKGDRTTPLSTFLLQTRSGHCEYFATATTLLLRAAGIPARYAVGYSVREFSPLENQYLVRSRHAHAWTLVYIDSKWQAFDTTPADWNQIEDAFASKWAFISDLWSLLGFKLAVLLNAIAGNNKLKHWWWLLFLPIVVITWRFSRKKRVLRLYTKQILSPKSTTYKQNNRDSEFYLVEQRLNELGFFRNPSESLKNWVKRLNKELPASNLIEDLVTLIELHYRYRFDPQGIKETERASLKSAVRSWLDKYKQ